MEHIKSGIVFSAWSYYLLWFSRACLTLSCQCFIAECANEVHIWLSGPPVRRYEIHKHSSGVNPNIHNKYKIFLPLNLCIKLCKINWEYFSVKSYHTGAHGLLTQVFLLVLLNYTFSLNCRAMFKLHFFQISITLLFYSHLFMSF